MRTGFDTVVRDGITRTPSLDVSTSARDHEALGLRAWKDLLLGVSLALLGHLCVAVVGWELTGRGVAFEPAGPAEAMTVELVADAPISETPCLPRGAPATASPRPERRSPAPSGATDGPIPSACGTTELIALRGTEESPLRTPAPEGPATPAEETGGTDTGRAHPLSPCAASASPDSAGLASGRGEGSVPGYQASTHGSFVGPRPPAYGQRLDLEYPQFARRCGYQGTALLRVRVLEDGRVAAVQIKESSGYHILDSTASKAVWTWRFTSALAAGKPVASWVLVPITFRLR